jgi:hypothetical protein
VHLRSPVRIDAMTDTSNTTATLAVPRRSRLATIALWVGIVAGVVFIVGAIFWTGFALGSHSQHGGPHGERGRGDMIIGPEHRMGPPMLPIPPGFRPQPQQPGQPGQPPAQQPTTPQPTPAARP